MITGASGNVGSELLKLFRRHGRPCIAAGRTNKWENVPDVEYRRLDFGDPQTFEAASGVTRLFLVRPPRISNVKKCIAPFLRRCRECGVEKVVFLSLIGVDKIPVVPHHAIEKQIRRLGFTFTFLRAGFFMQNLSTNHAEEIRERNELVAPCGKGRTTFVHARDIAEVAFRALHGEIASSRLDVTGKDTLTYEEVAAKLTEVLGRKITYRSPSLINFVRYRMRHGTPLKFALIMAGIYLPTRFGGAHYRGGTRLETYLGRAPVGMDTYLREAKGVWQ